MPCMVTIARHGTAPTREYYAVIQHAQCWWAVFLFSKCNKHLAGCQKNLTAIKLTTWATTFRLPRRGIEPAAALRVPRHQRRHLGGWGSPPLLRKKKKRKKKRKKRKKREKRKKGTMKSVKLLHIALSSAVFSNFSIVRWHWKIIRKFGPSKKKLKWRPCETSALPLGHRPSLTKNH